jgi:hypothetical protein
VSGKLIKRERDFGEGDSIHRNNTRPAVAFPMCGIKHNKTIAAKKLSRCLKSCAHIVFFCLLGGRKLN